MPLIPIIADPFWSTWAGSSTSTGGSVQYKLDTNNTALAALAGFKNDCRVTMQAFLNSCASLSVGAIISQQYGLSLDSTDTGLVIPSNSHIKFASGGAFRLLSHSTTGYAMFYMSGSNIYIEDACLDGAKEINGQAPGGVDNEFGMGMTLDEATDVTLVRPRIKNTWGDGIYIGGSTYCQRVQIQEPYISAVRRNGISVIGCSALEIWSPVITFVNDTNPKAGIDWEPNSNSNRVTANFVYNPRTIGCNLGLEFAIGGLVGTNSQNVSIDVYAWEDIRSQDTSLNRYGLAKGSRSISGHIALHTVTYVRPNILHDFGESYDNSVVFTVSAETTIA